MKHKLFTLILSGLAIFLFSFVIKGGKEESTENDTCKRDESVEKCKGDLNPFRYSGVKTTHIVSKPYDQIIEVAMPLYFDTEYRFVFNLDGLNPNIKVEVYDKTQRDDSRKKLFESSAKHFQYEPDPSLGLNRLYINYVVPPVESSGESETIEKGCVVFTTGYKNV